MERDRTSDQWLEAIAAFATGPQVAPDAERREAILVRVADTIGCALGATGADAAEVATAYAARRGAGVHSVWGSDISTDLESACLANGVAARYLDYNDAYFGIEPIHPSDVIPALFACALEKGRDDNAFLDAIAVSYEVMMASADCINPRQSGFDHVNVTMLGAVAGAARLLGLSDQQARHAVAIAVTSHAAYRQARTGQLSMWKAFAAADACRHAIYAALLASLGARGPSAPFTGQNAMFQRALGLPPDQFPELPLVPGQSAGRIAGSQIKRFPCGSVGQSAAQAATDLVARGIALPEVTAIDMRLDPKSAALMVSPEKLEPQTRETADHSIPYVVVSTLHRGSLDVESFTGESISNGTVRDFLRDRVKVQADPELGGGHDMGFPVALCITMRDGRTEEHSVEHPPGSPRNPMSRTDLKAKFDASVRRSHLASRSAEIWDMTWSMGGDAMTLPALDRCLRARSQTTSRPARTNRR
jgi:2-methylcitrate dehydratase